MGCKEFPIRKEGIFRPGKEIKGLRGGVHRYAAQENPKIDPALAGPGWKRALSGSKLLGINTVPTGLAPHPAMKELPFRGRK